MKPILIFILFTIASASCDRMEYYPDKPIVDPKTYILAHKGGGNFDAGNTLQACIYGLTNADGIECDLQMSSDNTIWLDHSPFTLACHPFEALCFHSISDKTIIQIDSCLGPQVNYTQLEAVFDYMSTHYPHKFISLDVKAWAPCEITGINITRQMNELAQSIIHLTKKYHLENQVMVESETGDFLYYVKTNSEGIGTYLATFGDFELGVSRALDAGFTGISFQFKYKEPIVKEQIELLHRKGLKIQLWTLTEPADIEEALLLGVDFIQTDIF